MAELTGKLGFGCMRLPRLESGEVDMALFTQRVDAYMANGFNYFDTADKYMGGKSEPALRRALVERYPRDSYILTTKLSNEFMRSREEQARVFDEQLSILGVEYFDYYLLHNQGAGNYKVSCELDSFAFVHEKQREGKVSHIGMSYHDNAELLDEILIAHPEIEVVQLQINYLDWENESIQSRKCLEVANRHGKRVFVMEPIKGGNLVRLPEAAEKLFRDHAPDASPASWALRFAASQPGVQVVLSGMNSMAQLEDNMRALGDFTPMTEEETALTQAAAKLISASLPIPCTGCGYCTVQCPKKIPIPEYFALFQQGYMSTQLVYYWNIAQSKSRAGDCVKCGVCMKHCPQHIEIPRHLSEISERFDGFKGWR